MVNPLIEGVIPVKGQGFVARENGNFSPGEYKRLSNMEIDDAGGLVNRRNVSSVYGEATGVAVTPVTNGQRFLGNMGEYTLFTNGTKQWMVGANTFFEIWNALTNPGSGSSFARMVGFFRYNNRNHWIVLEFNQGVSIGLSIYRDASIPVPDVPETYAPGYQASLTRTVILTFAAGTNDFSNFQFKNFFLYKDRLWIATSVGLYFSEATNPINFVAPAGGFFKHPDNRVTYAMAIKDNIYTLCDNAVYSLTYTTDPNTDSTERPLSTTIGGEMGCIHLDTPYFINNLGIFSINGNNVEKVMDSRFDYGLDTYYNKIYSFEQYLIVSKFNVINYDNNYADPSRVGIRTQYWPNPESDTVGGTQILTGWTQTTSGAAVTRQNRCQNPSFEVNTTFWTVYGTATLTRDTSHAAVPTWGSGTCSAAIARTTTTGTLDIGMTSNAMGATALNGYTGSAYVLSNISRNVMIAIRWLNGSNTVVSSSTQTVSVTNIWTRISVSAVAPAGLGVVSAKLEVIFLGVAGSQGNQYVDAVLFEELLTLEEYFDGSITDTAVLNYSWAGTAHNSMSNLTITIINPFALNTVLDGQPGRVLSIGGELTPWVWWQTVNSHLVSTGVYTDAIYTLNPVATIVPNISYTLRFEHRLLYNFTAPDPIGKFDCIVEFLNVSSTVIGSTTAPIDTTYNWTSGYNTFSMEVTPPANTDAIRVRLRLQFTQPGPSGQGVYEDYNIYVNRLHFEKTSAFSGYFSGDTTDTVSIIYAWTGTAFNSPSTASPDTHGYLKNLGSSFTPFQEGNSLGYNTYFINTDNGAVHVLDFVDQCSSDPPNVGAAGFIVDAITNPFKDVSGNYKWVFFTNKMISSTPAGLTYAGNCYFMGSSETVLINDFAVDTDNVLRRVPPKIDVEIDSYVPDGLEYRIKKFRSLEVQGIIPPVGMELRTAYDNSDYVQTVELGDDEGLLTASRRHFAHRVGLNQRGHSLTVRFSNPDWNVPISAPFGNFEISDLRTLWTYSGRGPVSKSVSS